jgi:hypothetical protein
MKLFHKWAIAFAVLMLSAFQINSYHADKYNINWLYWVICFVAGGFVAYWGYKGFTNNDGSKDEVV